jgi:transcriptional regulator with XRE-family HTH domain
MSTIETYFGPYLKELRLKNKLTLREFCRKANQDPAYISKVERRLISAPQNVEVLVRFGPVMGLLEDEQERLNDLAFTDNGLIPPDVWEIRDSATYLPAFWHGWRRLPQEEIDRFIQKCREA